MVIVDAGKEPLRGLDQLLDAEAFDTVEDKMDFFLIFVQHLDNLADHPNLVQVGGRVRSIGVDDQHQADGAGRGVEGAGDHFHPFLAGEGDGCKDAGEGRAGPDRQDRQAGGQKFAGKDQIGTGFARFCRVGGFNRIRNMLFVHDFILCKVFLQLSHAKQACQCAACL